MSLYLILSATLLAGLSGLVGLALGRDPAGRSRWAAALMLLAAGLGLAGAGLGCIQTGETRLVCSWLQSTNSLAVGLDALSAFFLAPVFLIGGLGALYGQGYWHGGDKTKTTTKLSVFWGSAIAGMALLILARQAWVFLVGWETMALSAFFLIATEDQEAPVRQAAWLYLIATHVGTLSLFAMFVLLRQASGSWQFGPLDAAQVGLGTLTAIFFLALAGFGLKAGLMPLHFWLPGAHANAPSHVSALLSGVMIKMGIYGLVRISGYLPEPPLAWGGILLTVGLISGVLGVLFALAQHDLKRLLAYHSIENIGIIAMGLGLALAGRSRNQPAWVVLGLSGCLLHVWNHGLFKALLFLGAGSVNHATGTRALDQLGGLARRMPWTAGLFLIGAVAICGLPPLNGFVSEWLIYLGLFRALGIDQGPSWMGAAVGAPALALIGALAVACFVKVYGTVFLGAPRSAAAASAHEAPGSMLWPMGLLAVSCAAIGLGPFLLAPVLDATVAAWTGTAVSPLPVGTVAPLVTLSVGTVTLALAIGLVALAVRRGLRRNPAAAQPTWGCGYAAPTARMQYTASSFAQMLVRLFRTVLRPRANPPAITALFPPPAEFDSHVDDAVLDRHLLPAWRRFVAGLRRLHALQQGFTQQYVLYILVMVVVLLLYTLPMDQWVTNLFAR